MTSRRERMIEDLHVRDAARALVEADVRHLRTSLSVKSIGERAVDRLAGGAGEVFEEAKDLASENKGVLAAIVAALVLWFAREPIHESLTGADDR